MSNNAFVRACVSMCVCVAIVFLHSINLLNYWRLYEGWNFNSGNYLFTTDTK